MKTDKKQSFKGAVLLTVVSVMSLLIVFLTSTLVLATAANNRAHKSYSSSQANYTARTAIDSILAAVGKDTNFAQAMASLNTVGAGFDVDVNMEATSAGMGKVTKAHVECVANNKKYYDSSENEWVDKDLIAITADVLYAGETKTVTAYVLKNPPQSINNPGGGGGFVTVGDATIANHTNSLGGTYFGIGLGTGNRLYQGDYPIGHVDLEQKLYLNVKDGVDYTWIDGKPYYFPETDDIMHTYYSGNDQTIEAPFVVNGNFVVNTQTQVTFPKKGSGMAIWGNLDIQNSSFKVYSETVNNAAAVAFNQEIKTFKDIPYIYVDSLLKLNNQTIGNDNLPLNIFCGSINAQQNGVDLYANVYCQDATKTSIIGNTDTKLHSWSNSVLNKTDNYLATCTSGNFYTKGNLIVNGNGASIDGDLVVEGDLTIKGNLNVGGSVVVKGTLKVESGSINAGGNIDATFATGNNITENVSPKVKPGTSEPLYEEYTYSDGYCVLALNGKVYQDEWNTPEFPYVWLKPEAAAAYGLADSDGDGIIDNNCFDLGGAEVDKSLVVETSHYVGDTNTVKKEYLKTAWRNTVNDTTTENYLDTIDAAGFKYNGTEIGDPSLYADVHNHELFPRRAEKAVILGFEEIGDGTAKADSTIVKIVDDIEQDYNFSTNSITEIPEAGGVRAAVESKVYHSYDIPDAPIETSCTLEGSDFNKTIYVKNTSTNDIWIKLKNFAMDAKDYEDYGIIYDDSSPNCGKLILFIEGSAKLNKGRIMTKSYYDLIKSGQNFQIATDNDLYIPGMTKGGCPKIKIYSTEATYNPDGSVASRPLLFMENNSIVTACIEAPNLDFDLKTAASVPGIYYNGIETNTKPGGLSNVGVIGVLNVASADGQNNWTFFYTADTSSMPSITPSTPSDASYVITYYEGF